MVSNYHAMIMGVTWIGCCDTQGKDRDSTRVLSKSHAVIVVLPGCVFVNTTTQGKDRDTTMVLGNNHSVIADKDFVYCSTIIHDRTNFLSCTIVCHWLNFM